MKALIIYYYESVNNLLLKSVNNLKSVYYIKSVDKFNSVDKMKSVLLC
jgi:hypothetical protein